MDRNGRRGCAITILIVAIGIVIAFIYLCTSVAGFAGAMFGFVISLLALSLIAKLIGKINR